MTDQEKIMSWLEGLTQDDWHQFHSDSEVSNIAKATLALMKEHEAVEPKHNPLSPTDWFCGKCGMPISRFHDYCPSCGQAVEWNEVRTN